MSEEHLSAKEEELFRQLARKQPAGHLEDKVVARLKSEKLIRPRNTRRLITQWVVSAAASVLIFLSGQYYGQLNTTDMIEIEATKGYMLLLHEDERFRPGDPMEMFEDYKSWMENAYASGVKITGQELKNEAVLVTVGEQVAVGEAAQKKTTGYFLLEADTMEEALKVAQANPHVKYGGVVEVKPFMVR